MAVSQARPPARRSRRWHTEVVAGLLAGLLLGAVAWLESEPAGQRLGQHLPGTLADAIGIPPAPTPIAAASCHAPATLVGRVGFDPYAILSTYRPDVLAYYAAYGWDPATRCTQIYDDWTGHIAPGAPTTVVAYVEQQGWAPRAAQPTPTPQPGCHAPPAEVARLGFDPYQVLALHRPDVLDLYRHNPAPGGQGNWDPATQCVAIFDDWLQHPDGKPAMTAAQFVVASGWATAGAAPTATATER